MATATFIDYSSSYVMQKQIAELYERHYPFAAEDFVAVTDNNIRHEALNVWITSLVATLEYTLQTWLLLHTHTTTAPGQQTSPPTVPLFIQYPIAPPLPVNTTGAIDNLVGNRMIPWEYLSYIDLESTGNIPITVFRRQLPIPINTAVITPPLVKI